MADEEFTSIEGTKITKDEIVQRKIDYYKGAFEEGKSQITDFNEGSEARNFVEATSIDAYELRYLIDDMKRVAFPQYSRNNYLDLIGAEHDCTRDPAKSSTGILTFQLAEIKSYDILLPAGTIITTDDDSVEVQTTEGVILTAGQLNINAAAEAVDAGEDGNVLPRTLTRVADPIVDLSVNNAAAFTGGVEAESDDSYRVRILDAEKTKVVGSIAWYKSQTENISGVHDAKVINNPNGTLYNVKIIVNGDIKPTLDDIINAVVAFFEDPENDIAGIELQITKPNYVEQTVAGTITLKDGYIWANVSADAEHNVNCYFNGGEVTYSSEDNPISYPGLNTGDDIIRSTIQLVIANTPGVLDYNLTSPAANVVTTDEEEAHLATMNFTQG